jgi:hypothetical protein
VTRRALPKGPRLLEDHDFAWELVWPRIAGIGDGARRRGGLDVTLHRGARGRRHAVAEYRFGESRRIVAKLYQDVDEGHAAHRLLRAMWRGGFGGASTYRVPEPIGYLPEHGVLLMERVQGEALAGLLMFDGRSFRFGLLQAARWLGALHVSPLRLGPREDRLRDAFRMSRRLSEAIRCRPAVENVLRQAVEELALRAARVAEPRPAVQTHRRYEPRRVFLAPEHVTVIGLDSVAVADPMKDVADFIHRFRWESAMSGLGIAIVDDATHAFLTDYSQCGAGDLSSLGYQWSYSILWSLLGLACSRGTDDRDWTLRSRVLLDEFERVPRLSAALGAGDVSS